LRRRRVLKVGNSIYEASGAIDKELPVMGRT
jgi:hypothetical protein